jgi:hypothetical protein
VLRRWRRSHGARERGSASGAGGAAALLGAVEIAAGIEARAERLA